MMVRLFSQGAQFERFHLWARFDWISDLSKIWQRLAVAHQPSPAGRMEQTV